MRARGINYDTGFLPGLPSRPTFDPDAVRRDLAVIASELHCDVVRISGGDPERLSIAAQAAAAVGLEVWFAPFPVDLDPAETLALLLDCAARAEAIRAGGAEVVFIAGCEISLFGKGYLDGDAFTDRIETMTTAEPGFWMNTLPGILTQLNEFLHDAVPQIRERFGGRVSYASGPWEYIDWTPFDLAGIDAYRAGHNKDTFVDELHRVAGKPLVITEFGTCAYLGAGERGGMAWMLPDNPVPDEQEQVTYFNELFDIFEREGVDTALWFTFAGFSLPNEQDVGSYGVVRMLDETRWEPKAVFHAMASRYAQPGNLKASS